MLSSHEPTSSISYDYIIHTFLPCEMRGRILRHIDNYRAQTLRSRPEPASLIVMFGVHNLISFVLLISGMKYDINVCDSRIETLPLTIANISWRVLVG